MTRSNELDAAYAADGYARVKPHSIGVVVTTYFAFKSSRDFSDPFHKVRRRRVERHQWHRGWSVDTISFRRVYPLRSVQHFPRWSRYFMS